VLDPRQVVTFQGPGETQLQPVTLSNDDDNSGGLRKVMKAQKALDAPKALEYNFKLVDSADI
jgi:hypothetical protein